MRRNIIRIDESKCTGCGMCVTGCPEGALQVIDGKARLVGDLLCDGLGACLGNCPEGAITIETRDAEPYDEREVMARIVRQGSKVIAAHLEHLKAHRQTAYLQQALEYLEEKNIEAGCPQPGPSRGAHAGGCPGSRSVSFGVGINAAGGARSGGPPSHLTHWPIQLHLISPQAPHYQGSDLLLAADCVAYALGGFHTEHLNGRTLAIACPKLDEGQEVYVAKLAALIDQAVISSIRVMIMQVPCCGGLLRLAVKAAEQAARKVPLSVTVVGIHGDILQESRIETAV